MEKRTWVYTTKREEFDIIIRVLLKLGFMWDGFKSKVTQEKAMNAFGVNCHNYILFDMKKKWTYIKTIGVTGNMEVPKSLKQEFKDMDIISFDEFIAKLKRAKIYIGKVEWGYVILDCRNESAVEAALKEFCKVVGGMGISVEEFRKRIYPEKPLLVGYPVGVPIDRVQDGGEERLAIAFNGGKQALYYSQIHGGIYEVIYGGSSGGHLEANRVKVLMLKGVYSDLEPGDIFFDGEVSDEKSLNDESNYNVMINDDEYVCVGTKGRDIWTINVSKETREGEIYKVVEVA